MTARFQGTGDIHANTASAGNRARMLSPVTFRARMRQEEEERKREEPAPAPTDPPQKTEELPRRFSRHFGSHAPIVF